MYSRCNGTWADLTLLKFSRPLPTCIPHRDGQTQIKNRTQTLNVTHKSENKVPGLHIGNDNIAKQCEPKNSDRFSSLVQVHWETVKATFSADITWYISSIWTLDPGRNFVFTSTLYYNIVPVTDNFKTLCHSDLNWKWKYWTWWLLRNVVNMVSTDGLEYHIQITGIYTKKIEFE